MGETLEQRTAGELPGTAGTALTFRQKVILSILALAFLAEIGIAGCSGSYKRQTAQVPTNKPIPAANWTRSGLSVEQIIALGKEELKQYEKLELINRIPPLTPEGLDLSERELDLISKMGARYDFNKCMKEMQNLHAARGIRYLNEAIHRTDDLKIASTLHKILGAFYERRGQASCAIKEYVFALNAVPRDNYTKKQLAKLYAENGRRHVQEEESTLAITSFEQALKLDPNNKKVKQSLKHLYLKTGKNNGEIGFVRKAIKLEPSAMTYVTAAGIVIYFDPATAYTWYKQAEKLNPALKLSKEKFKALTEMVYYSDYNGERERPPINPSSIEYAGIELLKVYQPLLQNKLNGTMGGFNTRVDQYYSALNGFEREKQLRKQLRIAGDKPKPKPGFVTEHYILAKSYEKDGLWCEAIEQYDTILHDDGEEDCLIDSNERAAIYYLRASACLKSGNKLQAVEDCLTAIKKFRIDGDDY